MDGFEPSDHWGNWVKPQTFTALHVLAITVFLFSLQIRSCLTIPTEVLHEIKGNKKKNHCLTWTKNLIRILWICMRHITTRSLPMDWIRIRGPLTRQYTYTNSGIMSYYDQSLIIVEEIFLRRALFSSSDSKLILLASYFLYSNTLQNPKYVYLDFWYWS